MTVCVRDFREAYRLAHAAGWDAGNRRMARDGRNAWDAADFAHAAATFQAVVRALGYDETGSRYAAEPDTVSPGFAPHRRSAAHDQPALLRRQPRHSARARRH